MDGLKFLKQLTQESIKLVFFDPQYQGSLGKLKYGRNCRQKARRKLPQMSDALITEFLKEIERVLKPSGHLMFWIDKYILCNDIKELMHGINLQLVDLITWHKGKMGMGYRTRRTCEYLVIFQKSPLRAKGIWKFHNVPDVWSEKIMGKNHTHAKPIGLQKRLIETVTNASDIVVDPTAGGYSVLTAANEVKRNFLGCDILG
ncbi:MAG: site-specific DNA-methyltransferase [Bacteroidia bacterium]